MREEFRRIYEEMMTSMRPTSDFISEMRPLGDYGADLLEAMREQLNRDNLPGISRLIHLGFQVHSRAFTPFLCELLDEHRYDGYMEAIADLLLCIADERSVPAIIRALDYTVETDSEAHFTRNLLVALEKIRTDEAFDGVRTALNHPHPLVREEAAEALSRWTQPVNRDGEGS